MKNVSIFKEKCNKLLGHSLVVQNQVTFSGTVNVCSASCRCCATLCLFMAGPKQFKAKKKKDVHTTYYFGRIISKITILKTK